MIKHHDGKAIFPLGMYEQPREEAEWHEWRKAGINLLRCHSRDELDRAKKWGMVGWVPVQMILANNDDGSSLSDAIESLKDHPSLAVWEAPDEAIWNACRLETGRVTTRMWAEAPSVKETLRLRLDGLVDGLSKGSSLVRRIDPGHKIWLNEAAKSDQETLARCLPYLDIVGFDYYPIPEEPREGRAMNLIGPYTERFRRTAGSRDLWVVQQAFSWSTIRPQSGRPRALPNADQYRFMAWEAIAHGATGLLWWGSHYEGRPAPFLHDLMKVVEELNDLQPLLVAGDVARVRVWPDPRQNPAIAGVSGLVRRAGKRTMLVLVNEDYHEHDVIVSGIDWTGPGELRPFTEYAPEFKEAPEGWITRLEGCKVTIYTTGLPASAERAT